MFILFKKKKKTLSFQLSLQLCGKDVELFWIDKDEYNIIVVWSNTMIFTFDEKLRKNERMSKLN